MYRRHGKQVAALLLSALCIFLFASSGYAQKEEQKYPTHPINFIIPFPAGSSTDPAVHTLLQGIDTSPFFPFTKTYCSASRTL